MNTAKSIADVEELGKRLWYLTLALEPVAAYIEETGIDYTGYLHLLKKYVTDLFNKNTTIKDYNILNLINQCDIKKENEYGFLYWLWVCC